MENQETGYNHLALDRDKVLKFMLPFLEEKHGIRLFLQGLYFDGDETCVVATDGYKMATTHLLYHPDFDGKIIDPRSMEIVSRSYPDWKKARKVNYKTLDEYPDALTLPPGLSKPFIKKSAFIVEKNGRIASVRQIDVEEFKAANEDKDICWYRGEHLLPLFDIVKKHPLRAELFEDRLCVGNDFIRIEIMPTVFRKKSSPRD